MKTLYKILLIVVVSRIVMFAVSTACNQSFAYVNPNYMKVDAINSFPFVGQFDRWDSEIYIGIARVGYPLGYPNLTTDFPQYAHSLVVPTLAKADWAFFPLYPAVMKLGAFLFTPILSTTHALMLSGFLISNIAFFVSVYFFYKLTEKLFKNPQLTVIATIFYAFCGGTIFLSAIFTEALFMALALGAFYYLEENKLPYAILLGLLASLTRSDGFLIAIPFVVAAIMKIKENKKLSLKLLSSSLLVASGYLWFNVAGYFAAGHVFPIQIIARDLNWQVYPPITQQILTLGSQVTPSMASPNIFQEFYIISLALFCAPIVYFVLRRKVVFSLEKETIKYWAFYAAMMYVIFMASYIMSTIRYAIPLLPIYWVAAKVYSENRNFGIAYLALAIFLSIIGAYLFEISTPYFL
jgi:hypothetical protein